MRHIRLIAFEDEPTGTLGLIVKGCEGPEIFSDTSGRLLAHDILEHQNGVDAIGTIDDELMALGALWQVRGRHGDMVEDEGRRYSYQSPIDNLASDVLTCATDFDRRETQDWWPRIGQYKTKPHDYDEDFLQILEAARPMIRGELDRDSLNDFPLEAFMENALHLMRIGFNKAKRRFGMGYEGVSLFRAIRDAVKSAAKHLDYAGQEFVLSYGDGNARCYEFYGGEQWY